MIDFSIKIAGKIIRFKSDNPILEYDPRDEREFKNFIYRGAKKPDVTLEIKYGSVPEFKGKEKLFEVDGNWALSKYGDKILFEYPDRNLAGRTERAGEINGDMTEGVIYVNREKTAAEEEESKRQRELKKTEEDRKKEEERKKEMEERKTLNPEKPKDPTQVQAPKKKDTPLERGKKVMTEIKANFFQAFLVEYLIKNGVGFLVHCASVYTDGRLYLFMGKSEAGKSTIADFWHTRAGATVFNDDRAVLTVKEGLPYFYNAPWVGTLVNKCELGKGDKTKIDRIFFLQHDTVNTLKKVDKAAAAARIFRNSFPVFWERNALGYAINACTKIARSADCFELGFVNDASVVDFLKKELSAELNPAAV